MKRKSPGSRRHEPARQTRRLQIDRPATRRNSSSSKATRPAAPRSRAATTTRRPCCRCAARSSTAKTCRRRRCSQNQELADLVTAIGTGAGDKFHYDGLRYGKIILLMDADADGHHITTLLLDFFFRHMPELIRKGHVFIAQPPLYRIDVGKETHWARDDEHKEEILAGLKANAKLEITRFKGLGEMPFKRAGRDDARPEDRARC